MSTGSRERIARLLAYFNTFVIVFIPTLSFVNTFDRAGNLLQETTYYWPWLILIHIQPPSMRLILIHIQPPSMYMSDQWIVSGIPWILLVFAPFLYVLRACYDMYNNDENRVTNVLSVVGGAIMQMIFILMMSKSQVYVNEEIDLFFIPQIILVVVNGYIWFKWFYSDYQKKMNAAMEKKKLAGK